MAEWLSYNLGTIMVAVILILIIAAIIRSLVRTKKAGRSSCGCNCANCALGGSCHKKTG